MLPSPNSPDEEFELGARYDSGIGIARDPVLAATWFRKAAENGHPEAQFNLACMYDEGEGVPVNYDEAIKWFRKSAEQGLSDAQFELGRLFANGRSSTDTLPSLFRWLASLVIPPRIPVDTAEALKWYRLSAEQGHLNAQFLLANMLYLGEPGMTNFDEAAKWYESAAYQGHADAQLALGHCYFAGKGMRKSKQGALVWWMTASTFGQSDASQIVEIMKNNMTAKDRLLPSEIRRCELLATRVVESIKKSDTHKLLLVKAFLWGSSSTF